MDQKELSLKLKKHMLEHGITQQAMAERLGVTPAYLSAVLHNKRNISFTLSSLMRYVVEYGNIGKMKWISIYETLESNIEVPRYTELLAVVNGCQVYVIVKGTEKLRKCDWEDQVDGSIYSSDGNEPDETRVTHWLPIPEEPDAVCN